MRNECTVSRNKENETLTDLAMGAGQTNCDTSNNRPILIMKVTLERVPVQGKLLDSLVIIMY